MIDRFLELARLDALSGNERSVADYLLDFARTRGLSHREDDAGRENSSSAGNVLITYGDGGKTLFMSHMDTARSTKRLKPVLHEDRITSDGQTVLGVDNRVGITALLSALDVIVSQGLQCPGFTLVFTICEESSLAGSNFLSVPDSITQAYAFDSSYRPGTYICQAPGAKTFDVEVIGKASHSGIAPEAGINALQIAARAIAELPLGRVDQESTMNIGPFSSTAATNVIPPRVKFTGEMRSSTIAKVEALDLFLQKHLSKMLDGTGATFIYDSAWDFHPYTIETDAPLRLRLENAITAIGLKPVGLHSFGGSDVNVLNGKGVPAINLGVGAQNPHSNDEFILFEDLINATKIALELMRNAN
ncbi:MAG: M20/M25/M40 family metallo-hydrolase [Candidatus Marinimicrobia bacterium]|nr:M20/M25/M40 family metallo-hydrolase [Candidatus Neomarinimicrobiota bacterium]